MSRIPAQLTDDVGENLLVTNRLLVKLVKLLFDLAVVDVFESGLVELDAAPFNGQKFAELVHQLFTLEAGTGEVIFYGFDDFRHDVTPGLRVRDDGARRQWTI